MSTASKLQEVYDSLDWENYIGLCDKLLSINELLITGELSKSPSQFAYYNGLFRYAENQTGKFENQLEDLYNIKRNTVSMAMRRTGEKVTEKDIEACIQHDPEYINIKELLRAAKSKENLLRGLYEAFKQRHENLIQLSSNSRAEMKISS